MRSDDRQRGVLPKHKRNAHAPDAHLDDLLRFEDASPPLPTSSPERPWMLRAAVEAFAASAVVYTTFHVFDLDPPYVLILAICAAGVLVRHAVRLTAEPAWQRTKDAVRPRSGIRRIEPGGWFGDDDGMLGAVRRWDRRLDWGTTAPERFGATVCVRLAELADERLRQTHAITRASDPVRARRLLGEQVWILLHETVARVPTPRELSAVVDRLAAL